MDWLFAQPLDSVLSIRILIIVAMTAVASGALCALFAVLVGGGKHAALGTAAVPIAFLAGFFFFLGVPPAGSTDPLHILPYIVLLGLLAGIVIDVVTHIENIRLAVLLLWPAVIVVGIGWHEMPDFATIAGLPMALLWLSTVLSYVWMGTEHRFSSTSIVCLFSIALGLSCLGYIGDSKILAVLSAIYAAALFGFFVLNWPRPRFPMLATGNLGLVGIASALAVTEALYTETPPEAIAVLLLVLVVPPFAGPLPFGKGMKAGPIVLFFVTLLPVIGAIAAALHLKG